MRLTALLLTLPIALVVACGPAVTADSAARPRPTAVKSDSASAAVVDGTAITNEELDARAHDRLVQIRQQEYELRRQVLDEMILDRLMEKEAKARGISKEELVKGEVDAKLKPATSAEIDALYENAKGQLGGRTKDQVLPQIESYLKKQKEAEQRRQFESSLRDKSKIVVNLEAPRIPVTIPASEPSVGPETAAVTIVEFADYQCPYCHRAQGIVDEILAKYGTKVRFVHQDFPLENHARAFAAARAARCAGDQGKYWDFHRGMLRQPSDFSDDDFVKRAEGLSLDVEKFKTCVAGSSHDAAINAAHKLGGDLGVTGTPTFFVNGRMLYGARPSDQFSQVIDEELQRTASR
jgi:protein-disulfide isomerase